MASAEAAAPADASRGPPRHLLLYDGTCGLCHRLVRFVIRRDRKGRFAFAALQGERARAELAREGREPDLATFFLVEDFDGPERRLWQRGRGALRLLALLGWPWRAALVFWILPDLLLDAAYRLLAKVRYRVFGRSDACTLPSPEERRRFL